MKQLIPLIRVMLKSSFGNLQKKKISTAQKIGYGALAILLVFSFLPIVGLVFVLARTLFEILLPIQQEGLVFQVIFFMIALVVLIFGLLSIPGVYYFSKDTESYLVMPLRSETIIVARFVVALIYEYAIALFFYIPALVAYFTLADFSLIALLSSIIIAVFIPVIPLIIASLLVIFIFIGVPFIKNKDAYSYLISGFTIVFALGINYFTQKLAFVDPEKLLELFQEGSNSLVSIIGKILPHLAFGSYAIVNHSVLDLFIFIFIHAVAFALFILIARRFYFKGAIGINESGSSHKRMDQKTLNKSTQSKGVYYRYFMKDWMTLLRTPVYFLNCVSSVLIFPILMLIYMMTGILDFNALGEVITPFLSHPNILLIMVNIGFVIGFLSSSVNSVSASILTREGQNIFFMKMIPIPMFTQVMIKTSVGIMISIVSFILLVIPAAVIFQFPLHYILVLSICGLFSIIVANLICACVDVFHPKLNWDNENQAIKQNFNIGILSIILMSLSALTGAVTFMNMDNILFLTLPLILIIGLIFASYIYLKRLTVTNIEQIDL